MRWMMYRWWCEVVGDRAWWVIESVFLRSPDKGFWACLGDIPPDMPRRPETWVYEYANEFKQAALLHTELNYQRLTHRPTWYTWYISRTPLIARMSGGISPRHAQNPLSGERRKTLSITHHALSPPPSHHHLYIIHLINWLQRFYRIIMSLKRPFVPKSDVKQWFTTTTTSPATVIGAATTRSVRSACRHTYIAHNTITPDQPKPTGTAPRAILRSERSIST